MMTRFAFLLVLTVPVMMTGCVEVNCHAERETLIKACHKDYIYYDAALCPVARRAYYQCSAPKLMKGGE